MAMPPAAAAAPAGPRPPAPPTVTLKHLAAALAEQHEMSKKQAETVLGDLVGNIVKHLKKGERIRIGGLGILQVRKRAARMGRNHLAHSSGDAINAVLAAVGYNFRLLLRWLRLLLLKILIAFVRPLQLRFA